eukprot:1159853-Pelagomonas_calceolata.AAC.7
MLRSWGFIWGFTGTIASVLSESGVLSAEDIASSGNGDDLDERLPAAQVCFDRLAWSTSHDKQGELNAMRVASSTVDAES